MNENKSPERDPEFFYNRKNWVEYWKVYEGKIQGKDDSNADARIEAHKEVFQALGIKWDGSLERAVRKTEGPNLEGLGSKYASSFQAQFELSFSEGEKINGRLDAELRLKLNAGDFVYSFSNPELMNIVQQFIASSPHPEISKLRESLPGLIELANAMQKLPANLTPLEKAAKLADMLENNDLPYKAALTNYFIQFAAFTHLLDDVHAKELGEALVKQGFLQPGKKALDFFIMPVQWFPRYSLVFKEIVDMIKDNARKNKVDVKTVEPVIQATENLSARFSVIGKQLNGFQNVRSLAGGLRGSKSGVSTVQLNQLLEKVKDGLLNYHAMSFAQKEAHRYDLVQLLNDYALKISGKAGKNKLSRSEIDDVKIMINNVSFMVDAIKLINSAGLPNKLSLALNELGKKHEQFNAACDTAVQKLKPTVESDLAAAVPIFEDFKQKIAPKAPVKALEIKMADLRKEMDPDIRSIEKCKEILRGIKPKALGQKLTEQFEAKLTQGAVKITAQTVKELDQFARALDGALKEGEKVGKLGFARLLAKSPSVASALFDAEKTWSGAGKKRLKAVLKKPKPAPTERIRPR